MSQQLAAHDGKAERAAGRLEEREEDERRTKKGRESEREEQRFL